MRLPHMGGRCKRVVANRHETPAVEEQEAGARAALMRESARARPRTCGFASGHIREKSARGQRGSERR